MTDQNVFPSAMECSTEIGEIGKALAAFQADVPEIPRNSEVKYKGVNFKYADLPIILTKVRPVLAKQGLCITQCIEYKDARMILVTMLLHSSGQYIRSKLPLTGNLTDPKGVGAAITYSRRYALSSLIGIASDDDIDDEPNIRKSEDAKPRLTADQVAWCMGKIGDNALVLRNVLNAYGVKRLEDIPISCWEDLEARLNATVENQV